MIHSWYRHRENSARAFEIWPRCALISKERLKNSNKNDMWRSDCPETFPKSDRITSCVLFFVPMLPMVDVPVKAQRLWEWSCSVEAFLLHTNHKLSNCRTPTDTRFGSVFSKLVLAVCECRAPRTYALVGKPVNEDKSTAKMRWSNNTNVTDIYKWTDI